MRVPDGSGERRGVQHYEAGDAIGVPSGPGHPDHAAPIVHHERDVADVELLDQPGHVRHSGGQRVVVGTVAGLVGEAAADVIRCHGPVIAPQLSNQVTVQEGPARIAVQHENHLALTLVNVVHPVAADVQVVRGERIERAHQSTPNIMQLSPLPMPSRPTRWPGSRNPRSWARAADTGSPAVPVFPRYS